eukprot:TRINITY_DN3266_c0_g1_i1.p1 TRINITY_DN3266_c0_g1~~TRINITY_DN3266_c0_g1_i1.p1  ORF type:complete len:727 (-),score=146.31 TRINITY_DN3266_c0_g1_i1:37-2217(-)
MKFTVKVIEGRNLPAADFNGLSDPYCVVTIFGEEFKTKVKKKTLNPTWEETFVHTTNGIPKEGDSVSILVYDHDLIGKPTFLGQIIIPSSDLKAPSDKWYPLEAGKGKKKVKGDIHIVIEVHHDDANSDKKKRAIYRLVKKNKIAEVKSALEVGDVNLEARSKHDCTAIHYAARLGSVEMMQLLLSYFPDVNAVDSHANSALHIAIYRHQFEVAAVLVSSGANVNISNKEHNTPLHFLACNNEKDLNMDLKQAAVVLLGLVQQLLQKGADVNQNNSKMETPLHRAIQNDASLIALYLLKHGANPSIPSSDGMTPLHIACAKGAHRSIEILMSHGANPGIKTSQGSCFDVAERTNNKNVICRLFDHYNLTPQSQQDHIPLGDLESAISEFVQKHGVHFPDKDKREQRIRASTSGATTNSLSVSQTGSSGRSRSASISVVVENDPSTQFVMSKSLGEGAFGQVFRAKHKESGFVVAVKSMTLADDQKESIKKETRILQKCSHPNIVQYYGCFLKGDRIYLIMELCGVGCVLDLIKAIERPLTENELLCTILQVVKGLTYLHNNRIIHRDMKPQNILVTSLGVMKITDFGVSGHLESGQQAKTCVGTPLYMAPEIFLGEPYDFKADIWSLGITIIHMADGHAPNHNLPVMLAIGNITTKPPPTLTDPSKWSSKLNELVATCLVKDTKERSSAEVLEELLNSMFAKEHIEEQKVIDSLMAEYQKHKITHN